MVGDPVFFQVHVGGSIQDPLLHIFEPGQSEFWVQVVHVPDLHILPLAHTCTIGVAVVSTTHWVVFLVHTPPVQVLGPHRCCFCFVVVRVVASVQAGISFLLIVSTHWHGGGVGHVSLLHEQV